MKQHQVTNKTNGNSQPTSTQKPNILFGAFILLSNFIILWPVLSIALNPNPATSMILVVYGLPILIATVTLLVADGILLLRFAKRWLAHRKVLRLLCRIAGWALISLVVGNIVWNLLLLANYKLLEHKAETLISLDEAQRMIAECKVQLLQRSLATKLYIKEEFLATQEKGTYYTYRTTDQKYYDELSQLATNSKDQCGVVEISDPRRYQLPDEIKWASKEEVISLLASCSINELHLSDQLPDNQSIETVSGDKTGLLMIRSPESSGFHTSLYFVDTAADTKNMIVESARKEQPHCKYQLPQIQ